MAGSIVLNKRCRPAAGGGCSFSLARALLLDFAWTGKGKFFKGKISRANADGTYDVAYDDGDRERRVSKRNIRALGKKKKKKAGSAKKKKSSRYSTDEDTASDSAGDAGLGRGDRVEVRCRSGAEHTTLAGTASVIYALRATRRSGCALTACDASAFTLFTGKL